MTAAIVSHQHHDWLARLLTIGMPLGARGSVSLGLAQQCGRKTSNGLLNSLVAFWPMNESSASDDALDLHNNGLILTQQYSPPPVSGLVYPTARLFNPALYYHFYRNNEAILQAGDVDLTLAAWIYTNPGTMSLRYVAAQWNTSANREYAIFTWTDDRMRFGISTTGSNSVQATSDVPIPREQWFLFVGWHDAVNNTVNAQINNGSVASVANTAGIYVGSSNFCISKQVNAFGGFWDGRIGPVMLWKSTPGGGGALSADQRTALWNSGNGLPYAQFTI